MNDLLALAVDAHGGLARWEEISRFRAEVSISGELWAVKGKPSLLHEVVLEGETRDQRMKIAPFPWPGRYATWEPYRQTVQTDDGMLVAERRDPVATFAGLTQESLWDEFQVAYFGAVAGWNSFVVPFLFVRPDFAVEETEPWSEDGQGWRRLVVTYPDAVVSPCRQQAYCFDGDGLLRRLDYTVDADPAVEYPSEYQEFDGVMVPTRRRVYVRNPDGPPQFDSVFISLDVADVSFA